MRTAATITRSRIFFIDQSFEAFDAVGIGAGKRNRKGFQGFQYSLQSCRISLWLSDPKNNYPLMPFSGTSENGMESIRRGQGLNPTHPISASMSSGPMDQRSCGL
jgi:hypothetical protein